MKESGLQQLFDLPIFSQSPVPLEQVLPTDPAKAIEQDKLNKIRQNEGSSVVYTREQVVDFILDLVGYTSDKPLYLYKILEPSFGSGDFLLKIIERLLISIKSHKKTGFPLACLQDAVRAVEVEPEAFESTKKKILSLLDRYEVEGFLATRLVSSWLVKGDFLLLPFKDRFDFVAGNPPYIRQELIPSTLIYRYRSLYKTIYDRADIYVPFMEKSLGLLSETGQLGFICSDRWMKNRYGTPLRCLIAEKFSLRVYVDMYGTKAFKSDVIAYPAITVISRQKCAFTRTASKPSLDPKNLKKLAKALLSPTSPARESDVKEVLNSEKGADPWLLIPADQIKLIRRLENDFPLIEETGCKVGIGVASGADKAFIAKFDDLDVESDRKLPLVMTDDIASGALHWGGFGIVNPFLLDGSLVELDSYPRLKKFFEERHELISNRHCARKNPVKWYRTLDRIHPELTTKPKLLIPDLKGEPNVVFDSGHFYPHHNLYYVVAEEWDLHALQAVLLSSLTKFFVSSYSVRMQGGYLRFQAQYLRRIRLPYWENVAPKLRAELIDAAQSRNSATCNEATYELYRLTADEIGVLKEMEL